MFFYIDKSCQVKLVLLFKSLLLITDCALPPLQLDVRRGGPGSLSMPLSQGFRGESTPLVATNHAQEDIASKAMSANGSHGPLVNLSILSDLSSILKGGLSKRHRIFSQHEKAVAKRNSRFIRSLKHFQSIPQNDLIYQK